MRRIVVLVLLAVVVLGVYVTGASAMPDYRGNDGSRSTSGADGDRPFGLPQDPGCTAEPASARASNCDRGSRGGSACNAGARS